MKTTTLTIVDQVNCKFEGLDPVTRRKICDALKFLVPYARHMPSFKLGRWDGKISFCTVGGATYINLLERVLPIVIDAGYSVEIDDRRPPFSVSFPEITEDFLADQCWPEGHPFAGQPIMLRDYQVEAIRRYTQNLQSIQSISTGAGKTILTAALSKLCEPFGRTLVIVPSKSLVEQTEEDFVNLGLDVGVFYGDRKELGHAHTIITWQSLGIKSKQAKMDIDTDTLQQIIDGVVCVQVDECHAAKAQVLREVLAGPLAQVPIRWGLTGTIPKEPYEYLALFGTLGPVVGEIRAADLQKKDVLAQCEVEILQLTDDHYEFRDWHDEMDYLLSDRDRIRWIAEFCKSCSESGNTLILVDRIETGMALAELIPGASFVNGSTKSKDRKKEYKEVQVATNKVIIATYGVAAVGINIPRIFNLVLVEAGKSFVRVIQSIGRGLRKAQDKNSVRIYDICSTMKFSARHLGKRKVYYKEAGYPFTVKKIAYR
jgi:DNA or RNA helicases of superfamily II